VKTLGWGLVCALVLSGSLSAEGGKGDEKKPVRLYTNEDLDRVSPLRGQTGVLSEPAVADASAAVPVEAGKTRTEAYWRKEAARVRARLRALAERAEPLRHELAEARSNSSGRPRRGINPPPTAAREARLRALERQMAELQAELEDRARREGALPGWLR